MPSRTRAPLRACVDDGRRRRSEESRRVVLMVDCRRRVCRDLLMLAVLKVEVLPLNIETFKRYYCMLTILGIQS